MKRTMLLSVAMLLALTAHAGALRQTVKAGAKGTKAIVTMSPLGWAKACGKGLVYVVKKVV